MQYVDSSNVEAIGYVEDRQELHVRFLESGSYVYFNVPETVFVEFLQAPSKGRYLNAYIKGVYSYERL